MAVATLPVAAQARGEPVHAISHATLEPYWVRTLLIGIALTFLALFLFVPLVAVFAEALKKGWSVYLSAIIEPDAWSAIKLTLLTAAIAVPLNLMFGVAAAWTIAKFEFCGKNILLTLIDLPFSVSPVISGLIYVRIALQQSAPEHIAEWVLSGKADIGIATEGLSQFEDLISFPCYQWSHVIVVPEAHPLLSHALLTLQDLAAYPLITYDVGFTGRGHIDDAFKQAGIATDIVLTAMDSDVIQQYAALGLGVGIIASMAVEHSRGNGLRTIDATHLFAPNVTRLAVRRGAYLRSYTYDFILQFAPELTRANIRDALNPGGQ